MWMEKVAGIGPLGMDLSWEAQAGCAEAGAERGGCGQPGARPGRSLLALLSTIGQPTKGASQHPWHRHPARSCWPCPEGMAVPVHLHKRAATRVPMPFYSAVMELLKAWPLCPFYLSFVCWALAWPVQGWDTGPLSDRRGAEAQAHLVSCPSPPRCLSTEEMPRLARARSWPCSTLNSPLNPKVLRSASN